MLIGPYRCPILIWTYYSYLDLPVSHAVQATTVIVSTHSVAPVCAVRADRSIAAHTMAHATCTPLPTSVGQAVALVGVKQGLRRMLAGVMAGTRKGLAKALSSTLDNESTRRGLLPSHPCYECSSAD
jgi:hypothetical protein